MNCCDQSLKNGKSCNQGRECPVRQQLPAPARVATARPLYRRCDLMGVCQAPDASCQAECLMVRNPFKQAEVELVRPGHDDDQGIDLVMVVMVALIVLLTVVIVAGLSGFAWESRISLVEAWAVLRDVFWALAARWS